MRPEIVDLAVKARQLLIDKGWVKDRLRSVDGQFCMLGAVAEAAGADWGPLTDLRTVKVEMVLPPDKVRLVDETLDAIEGRLWDYETTVGCGREELARWQDQEDTSFEDVMAAFDLVTKEAQDE